MTRRRNLSAARRTTSPIGVLLLVAILGWLGQDALGSTLTVQGARTHSGNWAARVDIERTCSEDDRVLAPGSEYAGSATEEACVSLSAHEVDVLAGGDVIFRAGERIALGSGFSVANGASFRAVVGPGVAGSAFVESGHSDGAREYWARFYLFADELDLTGGEPFLHLVGRDASGDLEMGVGLIWNAALSEKRIFIQAAEDGGSLASTQGTEELVLPDGWHSLELRWKASSGLDDGLAEVCMDDTPDGGVQCARLSGLDNDTGRIESVRWGALEVPQGDLGTVFMDDFRARKLGPIGECAPASSCP